MELFGKTHIDFVGKRWIGFTLSLLLLAAGVTSLIMKGGPKLGIDFTGGILMQVKFNQTVPTEDIRTTLDGAGYKGTEIQDIVNSNSVIIRIPKSSIAVTEEVKKIEDALNTKLGDKGLVMERTEMVGPKVGEALSRQASLALFWSWIAIIIYVAFRFKSTVHGVAGVIALIHDVLVVLGIFSILNKEITLTVIAAFLTIVGYSINDTIVVYDRIRENTRLLRTNTLGEIINISVNDTLSRTTITSLTVVMALVALFFWGGEVIHDFSLAMLVGVLVGTYSSIAVASPLVYEWETRQAKKRAPVR
jgi:preprotein translocase subunit SecF